MKKFNWLLIILLFVQCKPSDVNNIDHSLPEFYAKTIEYKSLKENLYEISSDKYEGRKTGEPGQKKAAEFLKSFYIKNKIDPVENNYYQTISSSYFNGDYNDSENVMAFIKGTEFEEEVVVLSAHYDHLGVRDDGVVYNGADDDASGTVAVMEIAKAFKKASDKGHGPRRSILFLHFTAEEIGLLGSKYYTDNPVIPLDHTIANLNIDMIGRIDNKHLSNPDYVYIIGSDHLSSEMDSIVNQQNDKYTQLLLDYKYNDKNDPLGLYYRSDHYNFAKNNIPVIFFFSGLHNDYHKITDTAEKIEYDLLTKRSRLVFHTLWELVNRDDKIEVDKGE